MVIEMLINLEEVVVVAAVERSALEA